MPAGTEFDDVFARQCYLAQNAFGNKMGGLDDPIFSKRIAHNNP